MNKKIILLLTLATIIGGNAFGMHKNPDSRKRWGKNYDQQHVTLTNEYETLQKKLETLWPQLNQNKKNEPLWQQYIQSKKRYQEVIRERKHLDQAYASERPYTEIAVRWCVDSLLWLVISKDG